MPAGDNSANLLQQHSLHCHVGDPAIRTSISVHGLVKVLSFHAMLPGKASTRLQTVAYMNSRVVCPAVLDSLSPHTHWKHHLDAVSCTTPTSV